MSEHGYCKRRHEPIGQDNEHIGQDSTMSDDCCECQVSEHGYCKLRRELISQDIEHIDQGSSMSDDCCGHAAQIKDLQEKIWQLEREVISSLS